MPDFDAAFDALVHLDDKGRLALRVSGQMYEELYLAATPAPRRPNGFSNGCTPGRPSGASSST